VSGNYFEFPYRIIEKRRRRGKRGKCRCSMCRKRPVVTGVERVKRKIRIAK
jgi:hypothetical protein